MGGGGTEGPFGPKVGAKFSLLHSPTSKFAQLFENLEFCSLTFFAVVSEMTQGILIAKYDSVGCKQYLRKTE